MKNNLRYIKTGIAIAVMTGIGYAVEPLSPAADNATMADLAKTVSRIKSKAGVDFGGDFYSRGLMVPVTGPLVDSTKAKKNREDVLFTALDLQLTVGPHSALQGRADLRLHQDWRNMFGSYATPLSVHWISLNGNMKDMFFYNLGDFKEKFTPLTVWAPEPSIINEPYIFARQRQLVMDEVYAGNNNRVLQGGNFTFSAKISPLFDEVTSETYFARNRKAGKEEYTIRPEAVDAFTVEMDRYSLGENLRIKLLKDIALGGSVVYTGDALATHKAGGDKETNKADMNKNLVFGVNGGVGTTVIRGLDSTKLLVRLNGEFASSVYQTFTLNDKKDGVDQKNEKGTALSASLFTRVALGRIGVFKADLGFVQNSPTYINEMAQSPAYFNRQILNSGVKGAYNSFDGLYKSVFNYTPAESEFKVKEPENKIAWTRGTLTHDELVAVQLTQVGDDAAQVLSMDRTLSPVLPFGKATPNRSGVDMNGQIELLDKAILLDGDVKIMKTAKSYFKAMYDPKDTTKNTIIIDDMNVYSSQFMQLGAGGSLDIAKFGNWWNYPFVLSGSISHAQVFEKNIDTQYGVKDFTDFGNAGLYWKFWKRAAVMGGAQILLTRSTAIEEVNTDEAKLLQTNIAGGLEYTVTEGGTLSFTAGNISVANQLAGEDGTIDKARDFNTMQYDLLLTVKF